MENGTSETSSEAVSRHDIRRIKIALVTVVVVIVLTVTLLLWFSRPSTPWLFEGAYANYRCEKTVAVLPINITVRLEVVDYNDTRARLLTHVRMETGYLAPMEYQITTWVNLGENIYEVEGYTLEASYEDHTYLEGFETRHCTVYEYSIADMTMIYYVEKETGWPIKMAFRTFGVEFELILVKTNIRL